MAETIAPDQNQNKLSSDERNSLIAFGAPFGVFMAFIGVVSLIKQKDATSLWLHHPELWIYPLQTIICAGILFFYRKHYTFGPWKRTWIGGAIGILVLVIWIAPQAFFKVPARVEGFDPTVVSDPLLYQVVLVFRMLRLALVVPFLEEIFWRGLVMRYLINEKFTSVAFGTFARLAFSVTAILFMLEHQMVDYPVALAAGILYNAVACWTKSLGACVIAHAVTNLGLGIYVLMTKQWGFW